MTEVEIYWPATRPADQVFAAEAVLRDAGIHATCRLQPTRRGSETVLVLLTNAAIGPFFGALFGKLGDGGVGQPARLYRSPPQAHT